MPFDNNDVDLLFRTLTDSYVRKYLMDDEIISYEKAKEFCSINEQQFELEDSGLWKILVKQNNKFAGFVGLWYFFEEPQPQLLYALLEENTKKGYAIESSNAVIDYAFTKLQYSYLIAACDTVNAESKKVCEKLNMTETEEREINGNRTTFYMLNR